MGYERRSQVKHCRLAWLLFHHCMDKQSDASSAVITKQ